MSYRKKHVKNKIYKIKPKRSVFGRLWFWVSIFGFALFFTVAYFLFFYPGVEVRNIAISGNERVETQDLTEFVLNNARTGLINMGTLKIASRSFFLVNTVDLNKKILERFPLIEKINISKKWPQTLTLGIVERKPVGVYCQLEKCFFVDQNGIAFEEPATIPPGMSIIKMVSENKEAFVGDDVVSINIMVAIAKIQKNLKDNLQVDVKEALITSPIRLNVTTSEYWKIYFDLSPDADIDFQLTKLGLLLEGEVKDRKNLRYINLIPKDRGIICDNNICGD